MDNYDEVEEMILIPNQMYGVYGKDVELPEAAGIHWIGRDATCVSLKSLTPTQYTMAPRDLAFSACWKKQGTDLLQLEYRSAAAQNAAAEAMEHDAATSSCAEMSWCSCSSPSVNAMITLAGPGGNRRARQHQAIILAR